MKNKNVGQVLPDNLINCHSRVLLSGIPTLNTQSGGDPRLQASGMTLNFNNTPSPALRASSPARGEGEQRRFASSLAGEVRRSRGEGRIARGFTSNCHAESFLFSISTALEKQGRDPEQQHLRMTLCKGFTLIELLVVVLIIGVLSAVALPQYQLAVDKSKTVQAFVAAKAIYDAEKIYFLANGSYTKELEDLDTSLLSCAGTSPHYRCGNFKLFFSLVSSIYVEPQPSIGAQIEFHFSDNARLCVASSIRGEKICKSLGGTPHPKAEGYFVLP